MGVRDREPTDRERGELTEEVYELAERWARRLSTPTSRPAGEHVDLVRAMGALTEAIEAETARCVDDARAAGVGDRRLAAAWGVSKQGAAKKWPRGTRRATEDAPSTVTEVLVAEPAPTVAAQTPTTPAPPVGATLVAPTESSDPEPASPRLRVGRRRADGSQRVTYGGIDIGTTRVSRYGTGYIALPADGEPALDDERIYGGPRPAADALLTHAHGKPAFKAALKAPKT